MAYNGARKTIMKKVFTLFAALAVLASASFAQQNKARRMTEKDYANMSAAAMFKAQNRKADKPTITATSTPKNITSFPWTEGFESGTPTGFNFIDADNDGYCWAVKTTSSDNYNTHSGDAVIASASWDADEGPLTPDNWMILPAFNIPTDATDFTLSWFEEGQDPDYADEYYSVYISTTGATVTDFGTTPVLSSTATGYWVKKTVDLSSYAGQTIYIAFRHHNITDMFVLNIDDIRVGGAEAPEISLAGPLNVLMNQPATFTATASTSTVTWYVDGSAETETGLTLTYTFTTEGLHEVVAEATNSVGSVYDTLAVNVIDCGDAISEFPYTEQFEAENPCWQFVSADPANDENTGITENGYNGTNAFTLSSYASAEDYNQFLISPEIDLTAANDMMVSFWYQGASAGDAFRVKVSSTTADTAAFTTVLGDYPTVSTEWTNVSLMLPNNTKYIAINYYGDYAYYLYIDNFTIDEMGAPTISISGDTYIGTGMEANYVANVNLADTVEWYVDGESVAGNGTTLTYMFTTAMNHEVVAVATNNYGEASDTLEVEVFDCSGVEIPYTPDFTMGLGCWSNRSDLTEDEGWFASVDMFESDPVGQILSISAQSFFGYMFDIPVDNWITSPSITMPESGSYEVAWSVKPFAPAYAGDHYGVYVVQGETATLLYEETLNSNMTDFVQRAAAIPANINGDFRIAFRHFDSEGGYVIIIDDIRVQALSAPTVELIGSTFAPLNTEVSFNAVSGTAESYVWTVDGTTVSENGTTLHHTFTTTGSHTVTVAGVNAVGTGDAASLTVNVVDCAISTLPYSQGFEDETAECWSLTDGFIVYNNPDYADYAHAGNGFLVGAYDDYADVDEWAISPAITMPASATGIVFGYYVQMNTYEGVDNHYEVRVSTTGNQPSDFTTLLKNEQGATEGYVYRGVSLESYAGQTIYIAIHNMTAAGGDAIFFDDLTIGQGQVTGIENASDINVAIYPNPVSSVLNIEGEGIQQVEVMDLNGRTILTSAATSLNLESLASGIYMVRVIAAEGIRVEKIVKK